MKRQYKDGPQMALRSVLYCWQSCKGNKVSLFCAACFVLSGFRQTGKRDYVQKNDLKFVSYSN